MVRVEIGKTLTHLHEQNSQSETDVIIFDTTQPADSSTGLPPVKAAVKHRKSVQSKDSTAQRSSEQEKTTQPAHTIFNSWLCGLLCVLLVWGFIKYKRKNKK